MPSSEHLPDWFPGRYPEDVTMKSCKPMLRETWGTAKLLRKNKNEVNIKVKSVRTFIEGKGVVDVLDCYGLTIESIYKSIGNLIEKYGKL